MGRSRSTQMYSNLTLRVVSHTYVESESDFRRHIILQTSERTQPSILTFPIKKTFSERGDKIQSFRRGRCFICVICGRHIFSETSETIDQ